MSDQSLQRNSSEHSPSSSDIDVLIQRLQLKPHPEGGFFSETWRGKTRVIVSDPHLTKVHDLGTNIYYLLRNGDVSKWHRIKEAEIFYWHAGGVLKVHTINSNGELKTRYIGDVLKHPDCHYEAYMEPNVWMALEPTSDSPYVLVGDASFPGFEFEDWQLGVRSELIRQFPQHADIIGRLT